MAPDGRDLVVTERGSNRIETLPLRFGRIGAPVVTASSGAVPFGFAFSPRGDLIVSEAGASTVSSYRLNGNGSLRPITAALAVGQGAACWVVVTADGRFAYTGNASGSISGFAVARDGSLTALTPGGLTAAAPRPNDLAVAGNYLYAVNPAAGEVTAYRLRDRRPPRRRPGRRQPRHRPRRTRRPLSPATAGRMTLLVHAIAPRYSVRAAVTRQVPVDPDAELLTRLRRGDEHAFRTLVGRHHATMLRVARLHVRDRQAAEEVVQETWLAVVQGLERFEERSTLKTWLFRILTNRAKTRGEREARSVPFSAVIARRDHAATIPPSTPTASKVRTTATRGSWAAPPPRWETLPDERLLSQETLREIDAAIEQLPPAQRAVIRLRDVEGWEADEVCEVLGLTSANQRVLLHRARSKVRGALERYLGDEVMAA